MQEKKSIGSKKKIDLNLLTEDSDSDKRGAIAGEGFASDR